MDKIVFAFDRQTARSKDADGRMRVRNCILSTAEVNPYRGREIPKSDELGLDANRVYDLYRDPEELGSPETLASFEGVPLMVKHVAQTARDPRKEYQAGAVHSLRFDGKHLRGDLLVSDGMAIDLIEADELSDLSCGYRYYPVMVPGKAGGDSYDGRMTQIRGNHVALVDDGRASGAHVADSAFVDPRKPDPTMQGDSNMAFPEAENAGAKPGEGQSPAAPAPAAGGDLSQVTSLLQQLITQNAQAHQAILAAVKGGTDAVPPAADPTAPPDGAPAAQDMDLEESPAHQGPKGAEDETGEKREEKEAREEARESEGARDNEMPSTEPNGEKDPQGASPAPEGFGPRGATTPFGAMDARTIKLVNSAVEAERKRNRDANEAKREVAHILGGDIALDSAEDVYREALVQVGVDVKDVPKGGAKVAWKGYKAAAARVAGVLPGAEGSMAMDSAPANAARESTRANLAKIKIRG